MYRRTLAGKVLVVTRASGIWKDISSAACSGQAYVGMTPDRSFMGQELSQQHARRFSSHATQKSEGKDGGQHRESMNNLRKNVRSEEEQRKVVEYKKAMVEYKKEMTILRKEVQQETKERRHAEAMSAALERRRIAKRKAAATAVKREKAAVNVALNVKKEAQQKANYEAGFREAARIYYEREERKKNIHGILLEELEAESKWWIVSPEDVTAKITDDIWEVPGNNSAGRQLTMPDEHLWRFSADVGLYEQEEEPSERNAYLRLKMFARMDEMRKADTYLRDRRRRWDNDTRGLLKDADRLLRKRQPAPPGYMARLEQAQQAQERQLLEEERWEAELARKDKMETEGGEEKS